MTKRLIIKDVEIFDTLLIQADERNIIYSLSFKGKQYVDKKKVLKWENDNANFTLFCRIVISIALLPILFFREQPKFWYSGFEFDFSFAFLFFAILIPSVGIYCYNYGTEYLFGIDDMILK
ncbi:hypothetical protein BH10BAC2_BH10BAC2_50090 [soil metagenome]